jgi:hypothetical protein
MTSERRAGTGPDRENSENRFTQESGAYYVLDGALEALPHHGMHPVTPAEC